MCSPLITILSVIKKATLARLERKLDWFTGEHEAFRLFKGCFICFLTLALSGAAFAISMPPVQTVFVIVLENHDWDEIKGSVDAPYLNHTLLPMASY